MAFATVVLKLKVRASISATIAKPRTVSGYFRKTQQQNKTSDFFNKFAVILTNLNE